MAWMEQLMMQVALVDGVTKPLLGIQRQVTALGDTVGQGYEQMALGAAAVVTGGLAVQAVLTPAIEMKQALAEVASPDMTQEMLDSLSHSALQFSVDYGQSAVGVLEYTAAMKKAMPGLPAAMLESVTQTSAILGAATKSDADTVSQYFRMLYGNYQQSADAMGQSEWAERVAGQTHLLTQRFGVSMDKMMAAVEGMHSLPSTMGVAMEEQLAILAMLQTRMGDGDAVTQFTALLEGATAAQEKLGIAMVDSQGNLMPIQQILQNIQPLIDQMGGAEAWALLDEAGLGDGALLLQQLIGDAETLDKTLASLKGVDGIDALSDKLKGTISQWERLTSAWYAIRAAAFSSVLPAIEAVVGMFADGAAVVVRWTQLFPHLTKAISYVVLAIAGLAIVTGAWVLLTALGTLVAKGWATALMLLKAPITVVSSLLKTFRAILLAVNLAMYANPAMLIAIAIGVVLVGAIAAAIYYWDDLMQLLADWGVFEGLEKVIASLSAGWQTFTAFLSDLSPFELLGDAVGWLIEQLNKIPGVSIEWDGFTDLPTAPTLSTQVSNEQITAPLARYRQGEPAAIPAGGLGQQLVQANARATAAAQPPGKRMQIGEVHNHFQNPLTPQQMAENLWLETPG